MDSNKLNFQENTANEIHSSAKWAKASAYVSIIGIAFGLLQFIVGFMKGNDSILSSLLSFLISGAISLVMAIQLLNYSKHIQAGLLGQQTHAINQAFHHLKTYLAIMGVLFIISIGLLMLGLIISILAFALT